MKYKFLFDKKVNASVPNHDDQDEMSIYDVNWSDKWKDLVIYPITWLQQKGYRKLHAGVLLTTRLVKGKVGGDGICRGPRDAFYFEPITKEKRFPEFVKEYLEESGYTSIVIIRGEQDELDNTCVRRSARFMNKVIINRKIPKRTSASEILYF